MRVHHWLCFPLFLLSGCATGFDRNAIETRLQLEPLTGLDADGVKNMNVKSELVFPCKIAVCLKTDSHDWRWEEKDRKVMLKWAQTLKEEGIASDVFMLPQMLSGKGEMTDLRYAAIKCGAAALFVIQGASQVDKYLNPAAMFYLTVVGGYIVPGSHRDALFMMEGCLFDPASGFVYAGVQAEGVGEIIRPTFIIEDKDAIDRAKAEALQSFGSEVLERMRKLAGRN